MLGSNNTVIDTTSVVLTLHYSPAGATSLVSDLVLFDFPFCDPHAIFKQSIEEGHA